MENTFEKKNDELRSEYTKELNLTPPIGHRIRRRKGDNTINFLPYKIVREGLFRRFLKKVFRIR